jgi:hypothetical protein
VGGVWSGPTTGLFRWCVVSVLLIAATASIQAALASDADRAALVHAEEPFLGEVSERTFRWFWEETPPTNGLTPDRSPPPSFSSIAAVGFALTSYGIGVERGYITREQAIARVLATLEFFYDAPQGDSARDDSGHRGFFYHFLSLDTGLRYRECELSTIDTALLMMGVLFCQSYFDRDTDEEARIRELADALYLRVEWDWARERPPLLAMGWHPEPGTGFGSADYKGYNEAMFLYVLALGSPTHPIPAEAWDAFTSTYLWADFHGYEHANFGPLFGHQYAHCWIDFRGIQDAYMRDRGIDYFENSRRATYAQRAYAIANPGRWQGYGPEIWGLTACDGPAGVALAIGGEARRFWSYFARGAGADGVHDDGTIAPTAAGGSIAFAPEIAIPALKAMRERYGDAVFTAHGFVDAFNPTFTDPEAQLLHGRVVPGLGWFDDQHLGIDQGPILIMIENLRSGFVWEVMRRHPHLVRGLQRAGFRGGWLDAGVGAEADSNNAGRPRSVSLDARSSKLDGGLRTPSAEPYGSAILAAGPRSARPGVVGTPTSTFAGRAVSEGGWQPPAFALGAPAWLYSAGAPKPEGRRRLAAVGEAASLHDPDR